MIAAAMLVSALPLQAAGEPVRSEAPNHTAAPTASLPNFSPEQALDRAREYIKDDDFNSAIDVLDSTITRLSTAIEQRRHLTEALREAYLLQVMAWVQYGSMLGQQPQGYHGAKQAEEKAEQYIIQCLSIKELRHTRPESGDKYPQLMVDLFERVRSQKLGGLQITKLSPSDAVVLLDGDTLRATGSRGVVGDTDLAAGSHRVVVYASGHKAITDEIVISPGGTQEKEYTLSKKRSRGWWAGVTAGALAVVGGVVALASGGSNSTEQPLPGPPAPPASSGH